MSGKPLIVLVHGAFHWGGCYQKVADLLARSGYPVATPDCSAHGYDSTPYNAVRDMADYCRPVEEVIASASEPVILVGHSGGGLVLSYLGEKYPDRIRLLTYLSAIMIPDGVTLFEYMMLERNAVFDFPPVFDQDGPSDGWNLKTSDRDILRATFYADCSDHDIKIAYANLIEHNPLAPPAWRVQLTPERFGAIPRTYIELSEDRALPLALQRRFQEDVPGASVRSIAASHSPFFSRPAELAQTIIDLA